MVNALLHVAALLAATAALASAQQSNSAVEVTPNTTPNPSPTPPTNQPSGTITPAPTPAPAVTSGLKELTAPAECTTALLKVDNDKIVVTCKGDTKGSHLLNSFTELEVGVEPPTTLIVEPLNVPTLDRLTIHGRVAGSTGVSNPLPGLQLNGALAGLRISSLSITQVEFVNTTVTLAIPATVAYLKLDSTNAIDLSLNVADNSSLNKVELTSNNFTKLPTCLYERKYPNQITATVTLTKNSTERLSKTEVENLKSNVNLDSLASVDVDVSCDESQPTNLETSNKHHICTDSSSVTPPSGSTSNSSTTPTPAATNSSSNGGSSNTTVIVVIVAVSVVVVVLAAVLFRQLAARKKKASQNNDNSVNLIGKEDASGNGKLSFISSDETLRALRLQQNEVTLTKALGPGALWLGEYNGNKVLVKRVEAETSDAYVTKNLMQQAQVLGTLSHENLVTLVGVTWIAGTDFALVAEFMDKSNLKQVLADTNWQLDLQTRLRMCLDVAQGLAYLHASEHRMYVRNFSSRKVLVNSSSECKVNLFDCYPSATKFESLETYGAGEVAWIAPELITRSSPQDPQKINMYAFGVVLCEILARAAPFQSLAEERGNTLSDVEIVAHIRRQKPLAPHEGRREYMRAPQSLRDAIDRCLSLSPLDRPSAADMIAAIELAQAEISATQQLI